MRRIKGIVRTVVAIAGAIGLNSPMIGMVAAGSEQGFASELNGFEGVVCKKGSQPTGVDQPAMRGRVDKFVGNGTRDVGAGEFQAVSGDEKHGGKHD